MDFLFSCFCCFDRHVLQVECKHGKSCGNRLWCSGVLQTEQSSSKSFLCSSNADESSRTETSMLFGIRNFKVSSSKSLARLPLSTAFSPLQPNAVLRQYAKAGCLNQCLLKLGKLTDSFKGKQSFRNPWISRVALIFFSHKTFDWQLSCMWKLQPPRACDERVSSMVSWWCHGYWQLVIWADGSKKTLKINRPK